MERLKSRKFWITIGTAAVVAASDQLGLDTDRVLALIALASTYLLGQSYVDRAAATPGVTQLKLPPFDPPTPVLPSNRTREWADPNPPKVGDPIDTPTPKDPGE